MISDLSFSDHILSMTSPNHLNIKDKNRLLENFRKLDSLEELDTFLIGNPIYKDPFFLTLWDTILAEQSDILITCIDSHAQLCRECNRVQSNFVRSLLKLHPLNSTKSWSLHDAP